MRHVELWTARTSHSTDTALFRCLGAPYLHAIRQRVTGITSVSCLVFTLALLGFRPFPYCLGLRLGVSQKSRAQHSRLPVSVWKMASALANTTKGLMHDRHEKEL